MGCIFKEVQAACPGNRVEGAFEYAKGGLERSKHGGDILRAAKPLRKGIAAAAEKGLGFIRFRV